MLTPRAVLAGAAALTFVAACASTPHPTPDAQAGTASKAAPGARARPTPPEGRLGNRVVPTGYDLSLTLDPNQERFSGTVEIALDVREAADVVWLNSAELKITAAQFVVGAGAPTAAEVVPGGEFLAGFVPAAPLAKGPAVLKVAFNGALSSTEWDGLFRQKDGDSWYAFTQFEPIGARHAFPCFDEPNFKVPWTVHLDVPRDLKAFSNMPVAKEQELAGGLKRVTFERTKPLPTYLIAAAVGPFEVIDAGTAGKNKTPIRVIVPRGHVAEAQSAKEMIPPLLDTLEGWFKIPFPYPKLDFVSIPLFPGAMENAGMITYTQGLLLVKPEEDSIKNLRDRTSVAAHEMAHQWFGDLVTMAWWDDVWLNESFATWMAFKTLERWKPEWNQPAERALDLAHALRADSVTSARRVRQVIRGVGDIRNAFDNGITYAKGSAVLSMLEGYVGEDAFQRGVVDYLIAHSYGNATASDFFGALSKSAGRDVSPVLASFIDQVGAPLVTAQKICEAGKPARVALSQAPYGRLGSSVDASLRWQVPVCLDWENGKARGHQCVILDKAQAEVTLGNEARCPAWIVPNAGGSGYYRALVKDAPLSGIQLAQGSTLTLPERILAIADAQALIQSGQLPPGDVYAQLKPLAGDVPWQVARLTADLTGMLDDDLVGPLRPQRARFLNRLFGPAVKQVGLQSRAGEPVNQRQLRPVVVGVLAGEAEDPALLAQARTITNAWLDGKATLDTELGDVLLRAAGSHADGALFDRLVARMRTSGDRRERFRMIFAAGALRDPAVLQQKLPTLFVPENDPREASFLFFTLSQSHEGRQAAFDYFTTHFDTLRTKFTRGMLGNLPGIGGAFCDAKSRDAVRGFFTPRLGDLPGADVTLAQVTERIDQCTARREQLGPSVAAFLKK